MLFMNMTPSNRLSELAVSHSIDILISLNGHL